MLNNLSSSSLADEKLFLHCLILNQTATYPELTAIYFQLLFGEDVYLEPVILVINSVSRSVEVESECIRPA